MEERIGRNQSGVGGTGVKVFVGRGDRAMAGRRLVEEQQGGG